MLNIISKYIKKKIVVFLGDSSSTIYLIDGIEIKEKFLLSGILDDDLKEARKIILKNPKYMVYLLIDNSDQTMSYGSFPAAKVSSFKKVVEKKIRKEYKKEDFKNYLVLKDRINKKKLSYVIIDIANSSPLSEWIKMLERTSATIAGIYSLPAESEVIAPYLDKVFYPKTTLKQDKKAKKKLSKEEKKKLKEQKQKEKQSENDEIDYEIEEESHDNKKKEKIAKIKIPRWKMLVLQNSNSGIRLVALKDNVVVFTRILHFETPTIEVELERALQIKSQIVDTIEYLKRIDYNDKDGINIYFLVSEFLAKPLKLQSGEKDSIKFVDLNEVQNSFFKKKSKFSCEKGADEFLATAFSRKGKFLFFLTRRMKKQAQLIVSNLLSTVMLFVIALVVGILFSINFYKIYKLESSISFNQSKERGYAKRLEKIREETFGRDIDENMVIEVDSVHKKLTRHSTSPVEIITDFAAIESNNFDIKNILAEEKREGQYVTKISASFMIEDLTFEELFVEYDSFIRSIKTKFSNYEINHSELPSTINLGASTKSIPVEIEIIGPNG